MLIMMESGSAKNSGLTLYRRAIDEGCGVATGPKVGRDTLLVLCNSGDQVQPYAAL